MGALVAPPVQMANSRWARKLLISDTTRTNQHGGGKKHQHRRRGHVRYRSR